ncbi:MAG: peroxide stress protein YaaA, partial [Pseudomonadota bacterium]
MRIVISPAKKLDFESWKPALRAKKINLEEPVFSTKAKKLAQIMRKKSAEELQNMMRISPTLSALNVERFKKFASADNISG